MAIGSNSNLVAVLASPVDRARDVDGLVLRAAEVRRLVIRDGLLCDGGLALTAQAIDPVARSRVERQRPPALAPRR